MDPWIVLFYGFAFVGLLHSALFSIHLLTQKRTADLLITIFLFIQSLIILEYVFYWTGLNATYPYLINISITLQFLFGPVLLTYVDFVLYENKKLKNYLFHFIPALVIFAFMLPYYFSTTNLKLYHSKMIPYFVLDLEIAVFPISSHMLLYFLFIVFKISREKRVGHIKNWILLITFLFGFYIVCYISYYIMVRLPWFTLTTDYFVSTGMCGSILAIIYFANGRKKILDGYSINESASLKNVYSSPNEHAENLYRNSSTDPLSTFTELNTAVQIPAHVNPYPTTDSDIISPSNVENKSEFDIKYKNSGLTPDAGKEIAEALFQLMKKEKLYQKSELKLETLAEKLGVAKHYVSQVINQYYKVNFFEYINLLRIEEAKQLLTSTDHQTLNIIEIAYLVGYNTKNTFNMAFRRIVGITPTEFRSQNKTSFN